MKDFLTVKEAADFLRVNRSTVWRWCNNKTLTSAFRIGRTWRISRLELEELTGQSFVQPETEQPDRTDYSTNR